ncbi:hypothetical protein WISP_89034 [Willisornis vidua]|uniref:Uncharacterized protein n=1 Tax=Willisornis vidua TaxID=1566151 RepID=A0ABQ9D223_9PASS|nr:hypothetical protein WISP_89034 [Willisornis vidua]
MGLFNSMNQQDPSVDITFCSIHYFEELPYVKSSEKRRERKVVYAIIEAYDEIEQDLVSLSIIIFLAADFFCEEVVEINTGIKKRLQCEELNAVDVSCTLQFQLQRDFSRTTIFVSYERQKKIKEDEKTFTCSV